MRENLLLPLVVRPVRTEATTEQLQANSLLFANSKIFEPPPQFGRVQNLLHEGKVTNYPTNLKRITYNYNARMRSTFDV